jgi:hypothetical protein
MVMMPRSANHPVLRPKRAWSIVTGAVVDIFTCVTLEREILVFRDHAVPGTRLCTFLPTRTTCLDWLGPSANPERGCACYLTISRGQMLRTPKMRGFGVTLVGSCYGENRCCAGKCFRISSTGTVRPLHRRSQGLDSDGDDPF